MEDKRSHNSRKGHPKDTKFGKNVELNLKTILGVVLQTISQPRKFVAKLSHATFWRLPDPDLTKISISHLNYLLNGIRVAELSKGSNIYHPAWTVTNVSVGKKLPFCIR